jgi:hypothetical protein
MSFGKDVKKFNKKVEKTATKIFRGTALELFVRIIKRTPVGNPSLWASGAPAGYVGGRLRGNWQVDINKSPDEQLDTIDASGTAPIANAATKMQRAKLGDTIHITNNLDYAEAVEDGHSSQAPAGMVKVTTTEFKNIVKSKSK